MPETPPAQRQADSRKSRMADGWRRVSVWLSPGDLDRLKMLAIDHGGQSGAIHDALIKLELSDLAERYK